MTVNDVYSFIEQIASFKMQESYDNSGFLIGDKTAQVTKICLCLDITLDVVEEAKKKGANLIISHHPVIFKPIRGITGKSPVREMIKSDINAICVHTNADVAFMGDVMLEKLGFSPSREAVEVINSEGAGFGRIATSHEFISPAELAFRCKKAFNSPSVRYVDGKKFVSRVGICSGAGGDCFAFAVENNCHAFITGEVKHSLLVEAKNLGITLIEAGHFSTEVIFCDFLKNKICERFTELAEDAIFTAESAVDICKYI
ncbi:MAG: Nif3-like dinuclear metal center hexameric protein [Oscillospiraceae bacterium]|nr:Nif3-like dinuclear metal center hexameric protein [Oscillospiraceae bacterium]